MLMRYFYKILKTIILQKYPQCGSPLKNKNMVQLEFSERKQSFRFSYADAPVKPSRYNTDSTTIATGSREKMIRLCRELSEIRNKGAVTLDVLKREIGKAI